MAKRNTQRNSGPHAKESAQRHWLLRDIVSLIVLAFPTYFASRYLLHLGGTALWLPSDWRGAVGIAGTGLGLTVFQYVRNRPAQPTRKQQPANAAATTPAAVAQNAADGDQRHERRKLRAAIGCLILGILLLTTYYGLRSACVFPWAGAQEWIQANYPDQSQNTDGVAARPNISAVPSFIDVERSMILVPVGVFQPPELRDYFDLVESDPSNAGLGDPVRQVLDREPDRIIDCLTGSGRMYLFSQIVPFLILYLGIVTSFGASLAYSFRSEEALGELAVEVR